MICVVGSLLDIVKQKTAYEMRISDWSSDVCSSDLPGIMSTKSRPSPGAAPPPLEGATRIIGSIALSTAVFMNVLDTSIANVSLPTISGYLGVSTSQGTWVITSFAVANAITVPLTRSEEHTSELQSLMRSSYAVFCLKKKKH